MITQWEVTKKNYHTFIAGLAKFDGMVFVSPHQPTSIAPGNRFSAELREEVIQQLESELDSDRHIWIVSDRPSALHAFLHAHISSQEEAQVDWLCAVPWAYNRQKAVYEGFGEFAILTLLLEKRGILNFHVPLALDENAAGLAAYGWYKRGEGFYSKRL